MTVHPVPNQSLENVNCNLRRMKPLNASEGSYPLHVAFKAESNSSESLLPAPLGNEPILERYGSDIREGPIEIRLREVVTAVGGRHVCLYSDGPGAVLLSDGEFELGAE